MMKYIMLLAIIMPLTGAVLSFFIPGRFARPRELLALAVTLLNLFLAVYLFPRGLSLTLPWFGDGMEFSLRLYSFSAFILLAVSAFGFLTALYSTAFMRGRDCLRQFYAYLMITIAFVNGAVLADSLLVLIFFWEGLLVAMFGMIAIGGKGSFRTAVKTLVILGIADLCMMLGIIITARLSGTFTISGISLPLNNTASLAFILLAIGAMAKAGSMPFHSWIPDAGTDAPLPFMALLPASIEKLLGIYFLTRICLDIFKLTPGSWLSPALMTIGGLTIVLAVMMALVQKNYKRLLSYHAISQVGYMILGIGTATPAGIVGGIFHMINNALYKSGLFFTAGAVERQTGTTDLEKLGGLGLKMPLTCACFIITALSISGVPPFNGFFSKELVYDGALERGRIFYLLAVAGSFFTAASFLKLGHAAFFDKPRGENKNIKDVGAAMQVPMIIIAAACVIFGLFNFIPVKWFIQPSLGEEALKGHAPCGMPANTGLVIITVVVLILAVLNHIYGVKKGGSGLKASEHIHRAPGLSVIYDKAQRGLTDPYNIGMRLADIFSNISWGCDKIINWFYDSFTVKSVFSLSRDIRRLHNGNYSVYLLWCLAGIFIVTLFLMYSV